MVTSQQLNPNDWPPGYIESVQEFLAEDYLRPPGKDLYEEVFQSDWFFPLQRHEELRQMIQMARTINPQTVFEIGSDKGGGLYHWCKCLPSVKRVIASEIRGTPYADAFERAFPHIKFLWLPVSSYAPETVGKVRVFFNDNTVCDEEKRIDILFIDGDKKGFYKDFLTYYPLMNPKGIIFCHDIRDDGPQQGAHMIHKHLDMPMEIILDTTDTDESMRNAELGLPPACPHDGWLRHWKGKSCCVGVFDLRKPHK